MSDIIPFLYILYAMARSRIATKMAALLSKEKGTVYKDPGGKINVCLVYPDNYRIAMSSLGFQGIYTLLNERPDVVCERAFLPEEEDIGEYIRTGAELISLESRRPLNRFDIIAFSVSFENNYPNIVKILTLAKMPVRAEDRKDRYPLLIMGGVCAFFNPEPIADFFDICFIGEAEEMLPEFIEAYKCSENRSDLYEKAIRIEGLYLPHFYEVSYKDNGSISARIALNNTPEKVKRRFVRDICRAPLRPSIITPETEFSRMYLIEAMRGCPWSCRFCVTGYVFNPPRKKEPDILKAGICSALSATKRVGLIGPSLTDYPYITDTLGIKGVDFSITSLRASPRSAELVSFLKGHKSVSIAPEAGTERLRVVIDKKITEHDIMETSRLLLSEGIENLRLYFMIGLPTETEEDIDGIISLVKKIRGLSAKGNIVLTVSTFITKPFTPFQWHPMEKMDVIKYRLKLLKRALLAIKGIKVFHDVTKYAYMQGLFSNGGRTISRVIEKMAETGDWQTACRDTGTDMAFYIFRHKDFHETLPWEFIDNGITREKLWAGYQEALTASAC